MIRRGSFVLFSNKCQHANSYGIILHTFKGPDNQTMASVFISPYVSDLFIIKENQTREQPIIPSTGQIVVEEIRLLNEVNLEQSSNISLDNRLYDIYNEIEL